MPEYRPFHDTPPIDRAVRCSSIRDKVLVGFVLFTLVRTSEALAGDQSPLTKAQVDPESGKSRFSSSSAAAAIPPVFTVPGLPESPRFSATDFRPRKHTVFDNDPANFYGDTPMLRGTTVWQRMADYKSHDRVRLLTLWETSGSTISLQAGKRGDPSLQWNSRLMNRGGSTQGLLDRLFTVSLAHTGNSLRNEARGAASIAASKPVDSPAVAGLKVPGRD
jgi:hypothetical protein